MARFFGRLVIVLSPVVALQVTVSNSLPRLDVDGNVIDCHSGNIVHVKSTFYMYGERYMNHTGIGGSATNMPVQPFQFPACLIHDRRSFATSSVPPACRVHEASCCIDLISIAMPFQKTKHRMLHALQPRPYDLDFSRTCPHNMAVVSIRHSVYALGSLRQNPQSFRYGLPSSIV